MKQKYSEGDLFLVPLKSGGYVRGLVARCKSRKPLIFAYFFKPIIKQLHEAKNQVTRKQILISMLAGDPGLKSGRWPIIGQLKGWDRSKWPIPPLMLKDPLLHGKGWLIQLCDQDPSVEISRKLVKFDPSITYAGLATSGCVEYELDGMLNSK